MIKIILSTFKTTFIIKNNNTVDSLVTLDLLTKQKGGKHRIVTKEKCHLFICIFDLFFFDSQSLWLRR